MPKPTRTPARIHGTTEPPRLAYAGTFAALAAALAFPVALMVFNPTLMFERGWEQYVGTTIYVWALIALGREVARFKANESAFVEAPGHLSDPAAIGADRRILPARLKGLAASKGAPAAGLMELNREGSALDQEEVAGRFTLPKYILYLLPVIGFIGTVEGIGNALKEISAVLPLVNDLPAFMSNLTKVTSALQIAFDSTLLALFLSASLMFVQTIVHRRADDLLARVDRWVVEHALSAFGARHNDDAALAAIGRKLDELAERMGAGIGPHVERFARSVETLPTALAGLHRGAESIDRLGENLAAIGTAGESLRRGVASLTRIEAALARDDEHSPQLDDIRRGVDRTCAAIEGMSASWSSSFEKTSRASQEQLARTLTSLKDAIDLLQVSMEQGHSLYRTIVKRAFQTYPTVSAENEAA